MRFDLKVEGGIERWNVCVEFFSFSFSEGVL